MALEDILKKLTKEGTFIHSDGELSNNFVEVAAIATDPEWIQTATEAIIPVFRKFGAKKIAVRESMDVAIATHISRELKIPLLLVSPLEQFFTQPVRGQFGKNEDVVVFSTCVKNPAGLAYACEVLKKKHLNVKGVVVLLNRSANIKEFSAGAGLEVFCIFNYLTKDGSKLEMTKEYIKLMGGRNV